MWRNYSSEQSFIHRSSPSQLITARRRVSEQSRAQTNRILLLPEATSEVKEIRASLRPQCVTVATQNSKHRGQWRTSSCVSSCVAGVCFSNGHDMFKCGSCESPPHFPPVTGSGHNVVQSAECRWTSEALMVPWLENQQQVNY